MSVEIIVTGLGPREYAVRVTEGEDTTEHHVVVPVSLLDELLLDEDDGADLVRASFAFLLERTTADAVPEELRLAELDDEHDDYLAQMKEQFS